VDLFIPDCKQVYKTFSEYNQQDATFLNLFILVRHSTCFRRFFPPPSGARNCTYSVRHWSDAVCAVLSSWWWTEKPSETCRASYRNKLWNVASCWLYSENVLAMHGLANATFKGIQKHMCMSQRNMGTCDESTLILNHNPKCRTMVGFTLPTALPSQTDSNIHWRRVGGPLSKSGQFEEENLTPMPRNQIKIFQLSNPSTMHYTTYVSTIKLTVAINAVKRHKTVVSINATKLTLVETAVKDTCFPCCI